MYFSSSVFYSNKDNVLLLPQMTEVSTAHAIKGLSTNSERQHAAWQVPITPAFALYGHKTRQPHLFCTWFLVAQNTTGFFLLCRGAPPQRYCSTKKKLLHSAFTTGHCAKGTSVSFQHLLLINF